MPPTEAGNKLGEMKKKEIKANVAKPFPFVELADFLPNWASKVCVLHKLCDVMPLLVFGCSQVAEKEE